MVPANTTTQVRGDAARLRQIYANLLENCLRYCPAGASVRLSASADDEHWICRIDDSGPGVDAATLKRLGERFFRAEQSRSREFGGSGLGLALCKRSAEAHGGQLEFSRSELGGLVVSLSLPLEKKP
jgi:two-component system sensor histidine kinase BaeS